MKISDSNICLSFKPVNYEFPDLKPNKKDLERFDLNWLRIEFKINVNDKEITDYVNCILTFEIKDFVEESRKIIRKNSGSIESPFMEPNFEISVDKKNEVYKINVKYLYDTSDDNGWKYIDINKNFDENEFIKFINEIKREFDLFPIR